MITDVKRERVAMKREEAITIMQLYKDELEHRIAKIDYDIREIDLYSIHLDAFEVAIEALSAEAEPTVIRCKTLLNAEDFEAVATRIRKENRNVIVIPCETEVASADAESREDYNETDGVITIEKQSAKDVGEIKHIVIHSPNYTRYFYNESMPTSAEVVQGWIPFTRRPMTEEEQKDYPNCTFMFDCVLPDDGDEILVSNGRFVWMDALCNDGDGCYLGSGDDIGEDMAWMPLPEPYEPKTERRG